MVSQSHVNSRPLKHHEFTWLLATFSKIDPSVQRELLKTIHEPITAACTLHFCTFFIAFSTYLITNATWSLLWTCSEVVVALTRLFLLRRLQITSSESTPLWLHRVTALWFISLGFAALQSIREGNLFFILLTSNMIIALQGSIASRVAPAPRLAAFLNVVLITPSILGTWSSQETWTYAIPISYFFSFLGIHQLTSRNYNILRDKIIAEHKNLSLLARDPLTGLANRRELRNKIEELKTSSFKNYALLCLDLDGFKAVNDQHGHLVGDQLLITVGQRIASMTRSDDLACRVGGDEFIVVLADIDEEGAGRKAAEMIANLSVPYHLPNGITSRIGVSIGIALAETTNIPLGSIVKKADDALYKAKREKKGTYKFWTSQEFSNPQSLPPTFSE